MTTTRVKDLCNFIPLLIFPFSAIAGSAILDLTVIIGSIIACYFLYKQKNNLKFNKYIILAIVFYLILLLSSFFSKDFFYSKSSIFYFRIFFFSFYIYFILNTNKNLIKYFFYTISFLILVLVFDSYYQILFEKNIVGLAPLNNTRVTSFFGDEIILGSFLLKIFPIFLALVFYFIKETFIKNFTIIISSLMVFSVIILSLERSSIFLIVLFFVSLIFLTKTSLFKKIFILISIGIFAFLIIANLNNVKQKRLEAFFDLNINNISIFLSKKNLEGAKLNHFIVDEKYSYLWASSIKIFKSNFLLGAGPKKFRKVCDEPKYNYEIRDSYGNLYNCSTHPHNFFFQLLSETGILGFLCYFVFYLFLIYDLFTVITKRNVSNYMVLIILYLSVFVNFFPFVTSGSIFNNWLSIMIFFPFGFIFYFKNLLIKK